MKEYSPLGELTISLDSIRKLTTFCKNRYIVFKIRNENDGREYQTSPSNPSKTRWLGVLKQVRLYIKAEADVVARAGNDSEMLVIVEKIN